MPIVEALFMVCPAGFEGGNALPTDAKIGFTLTAAQLASQYGVIANDGYLGKMIRLDFSPPLLPWRLSTINLSYMIYVDTSYLILRGAGSNPNTGTKIVFVPDADTRYDTIINDRILEYYRDKHLLQWDLDNMKYSWNYRDEIEQVQVTGTAVGGWLWPGRSVFRIGSSKVAGKFARPYDEAPRNRKELFRGSVNYHWRSDWKKLKGWMVSQERLKAGTIGGSGLFVNVTETKWVTTADEESNDIWIASPVKKNDFLHWGVETPEWFVNSYMFQDWRIRTGVETDGEGRLWHLDAPLRFDVHKSSIGDGSEPLEDEEIYAKAMPIAHVVHHVGIEDIYITQPIEGLNPEDAQRKYGNMAPEQAMHGIVFRFARDSWVQRIQTFMTGSHPIATEGAKNIQIQDNYFDGSWNKGKGGNGYLRGSRVWDSLYYNNTLRNLRHITMQWSSMGNVVILNNMTLSSKIWQLGIDGSNRITGTRYVHLGTADGLLKDWVFQEQTDWSLGPNTGGNSFINDPHTSIFLKDVSAAKGTIVDFSSIKGNDFCRGDTKPSVIGYYMGSSAGRTACQPFPPSAIDSTRFNHIVYAYAILGADGTVTIPADQVQVLQGVAGLKANDADLKVSIAIGGWGLGADPTNLRTVATNATFRKRIGTTVAALLRTYGIDGLNIEWWSTVSASQFNTLIKDILLGFTSGQTLSISTSHAFWSSAGINVVAAEIGQNVDYASVISHDTPGNVLQEINEESNFHDVVDRAHKNGFPRGKLSMGIPFYARARTLSDASCTADGCDLVAGLGTTSECISAGALGQGTYPYFSVDQFQTGSSDMDLEAAMGDQPFIFDDGRYVTSLGDILIYDTPTTLIRKARSATLLCMHGLSAFSIDQDTRDFDLTNALWSADGLVPTAEEIVATLVGEPLTPGGYVSEIFWEDMSLQLIEHYPNLPLVTLYHVFLLIAVRALDAVANSLREFLYFSDFNEDSFKLYKKWETKAMNWALANATAAGNDYWQCSANGNSYLHDTCPGPFNKGGVPQGHGDDVFWRLIDNDGFTSYMANEVGVDTSVLTTQDIYVGRNSQYCGIFGRREQTLNTVPRLPAEDDGTGRIRQGAPLHATRRHRRAASRRHHNEGLPDYDPADNKQGFSPYDPDKGCRTKWHDILLINEDFFPNVRLSIEAYLEQYESFKKTVIKASAANTNDPNEMMNLSNMIYTALTVLVSGNDTLGSAMDYIEQVRLDKQLQENYDALEEQARKAAIQFIIDIILTLLSFVPFAGEAAIAANAARAAASIFKAARVTRFVGRGLDKVADFVGDVKKIRSADEVLSDTARTGRGKIGKSLDKAQESSFQCEGSDYLGLFLDFSDLASTFVPTSVVRRETPPILSTSHGPNLDLLTSVDPISFGDLTRNNTSSNMHQLESRAAKIINDKAAYDSEARCIFLEGALKTDTLKDKPVYPRHCHEALADGSTTDPYSFQYFDYKKDGTKHYAMSDIKTITFSECRPQKAGSRDYVTVDPKFKKDAPTRPANLPKDPGDCQCDHLVEAQELRNGLILLEDGIRGPQPQALQDTAKKYQQLCKDPAYPKLLQDLVDKLNGPKNSSKGNYFNGVWDGDIKQDGGTGKAMKEAYDGADTPNTDLKYLRLRSDIIRKHIEDNSGRRTEVAKSFADPLTTYRDKLPAALKTEFDKQKFSLRLETNVKFAQDRYINQIDNIKGAKSTVASNKSSGKAAPVNGNKRAGSPLQSCKSKVANTGVGKLNTPALSVWK
ncbi:hypothetical protein BDZ94DRAFT_1236815 [Collybia nuda]|uniref:GH18 domain-containing protein n=1 Tax=Collybia nuda TaxID=64659 RepID=A0A9P6CJ58_9AGAR|nr:hypothetical protein BDZ94DRAFT_1236815 [Collybia nuda]